MKNSLKNILAISASILFFTACDVERLPETNISDATFWRSESDLKTANNYLYTFLPDFSTEDNWSDDAFGLASNNISDGSRLAPATAVADFNNQYLLIRASNNILEKGPKTGVAASILDRYLAEARFFRAWAYFNLLQRYGSVPLITKTLDDTSPELKAGSASRDEILNLIYADLDFAATKLPTATALGTADYGRIARTAALAFKGRVALFEGTRSKFHNYGDPKKHLALAFAAAKAVMDSKEHDLYAGPYFNLFQYEGEGRANRENVMVKQYGVSLTDRVTSHTYCRGILENGNKSPTKSLVDSYLMLDGLPMDKSPLYKAPVLSTDVFVNRDTRLSDDVLKKGDSYIFTNPIFNVSSLVFAKTGFTFRKYWNIVDWNNQASFIDRNLIRYAEVLLIYAESKFELDEAITDADLNLTINRLRKRGGVAPLTNDFAKTNGLSVRNEIRRERRVELAQEGFRYWDLIRWKTAEIELPKPVLGNFFFKEFGTTVKVNLTKDNFIITQDASFRKFDPNRDYLWPLPINEIALNPSMKQNPGW
jgi:starch-binding outer membrane protein, SusD/RagB family